MGCTGGRGWTAVLGCFQPTLLYESLWDIQLSLTLVWIATSLPWKLQIHSIDLITVSANTGSRIASRATLVVSRCAAARADRPARIWNVINRPRAAKWGDPSAQALSVLSGYQTSPAARISPAAVRPGSGRPIFPDSRDADSAVAEPPTAPLWA